MDRKLIHICEVCGKTEILTPEEAFNDGWDYPPRMGGSVYILSDLHFDDEDCMFMSPGWNSPQEQISIINGKVLCETDF